MTSEPRPERSAENPHALVAAGYERIAEGYATHLLKVRTNETYYRRFLDRCLGLVPSGGMVLDVGCGAGMVTLEITRKARVIGVDISATQIRLARHRAPDGAFVLADLGSCNSGRGLSIRSRRSGR